MKESQVEEAVVKWLNNKGYKVSKKYLNKNKKGVDIRACNEKSGDQFIIECKGDTKEPRIDFQTAIGQIIMRMEPSFDSNYYAIALPDNEKYRKLISEIPDRMRKLLRIRFLLLDSLGKVEELMPKVRIKHKRPVLPV